MTPLFVLQYFFRQALRGGGRVFFTDINQEEGLATKSELSAEYGVSNIEFSTQVLLKKTYK